MNNEKINSKIKLSNNWSFVILIFVILKFWNIGRSTFRRSKFWPPPLSGGWQGNDDRSGELLSGIWQGNDDRPGDCSQIAGKEMTTTRFQH